MARIFDELDRQKLVARIEVYDESMWIEKIQDGKPDVRYEIDPAGLAAAMAGAQDGTGLLPRGTLFVSRGGARVGLWHDAQVWRVQVAGIGLLRVPMPPLVIVGHEREWYLWAVKQYPSPGERLFRAPMPNVFPDGRVCHGSVAFPECSLRTIRDALKLIVGESEFNSHLASEGLLETWKKWDADGLSEFPLDLLGKTDKTIDEVMNV